MNVSDADKLFVADLIPHHLLGVKLIDDASIRSSDVRLKKLVFEMSSYHQHELRDLETWKTDWGIELNTRFPGNLTSQELNDLRVISEMDYDVKWLTLMIKHHEGAIEIANRLLASSSNPKTTSIALKVKKLNQLKFTRCENCFGHCATSQIPAPYVLTETFTSTRIFGYQVK